MILHMLELEIDELERMAGRDLSHWRETREVPEAVPEPVTRML